MSRIAWSILVALALLLLASDAVLGCVCELLPERATTEQARAMLVKDYSNASAVFSGQVIAVDRYKVKFKVDKLWKGDFGDEIVMSTGAKDNGDGTISTSSCDHHFGLREKHLVYAYGNSLEEMRTYKCTRTRLLKYAEQEMKDLDEFWPHVQRNIYSNGGDKEGHLPPVKTDNSYGLTQVFQREGGATRCEYSLSAEPGLLAGLSSLNLAGRVIVSPSYIDMEVLRQRQLRPNTLSVIDAT